MRTLYVSIFILAVVLNTTLKAQEIEINGSVKSSDEQIGLPGVSILVLGTTSGTITDASGNFNISVNSGTVLQFSYIGYVTQEVKIGNQSILEILLIPDVSQLQEVVVTSLGIARQVKALGYSVTEVEGEKFTEARENNLANALTGRIAGVNVSNVAGGPAGSTRVIIRGNKSLEGENQPLYVVDGIPIWNMNYGQAGVWGGYDFGDGMSSINPDDIQSIEVLKGANASALYGARAANGVINITTKKGKARKGIGVEFNSNFVFETIYDLRDLQREYGQGDYVREEPLNPESAYIAVTPRDQEEGYWWNTRSWGPRLGKGTFVAYDGVERAYIDRGDQWPKFYETGTAWTNSIALTGGNANQSFRFSASDLMHSSIFPNSGYNRFNTSISTDSKFGRKLQVSAKFMYSHEDMKNRQRLSDSPGNAFLAMYYIPANSDIDWYRGDPDKLGAIPPDQDAVSLSIWGRQPGEELPAGEHNWHQNPWWVAYQCFEADVKDRIIASGQLRFDITDFLFIQGKAGMDWSTRHETRGWPQGISFMRSGQLWEGELNFYEINLEYQLGFSDRFGPFSINAFAGGNWMRNRNEYLWIGGYGFTVPFLEFANNISLREWSFGEAETGINSLFGQAEIGYNGIVYLTGTFRNDWFSVLNKGYNSILYPSVGISLVFSDMINALPSWFSFGKLRASWAQVGSVTVNPYQSDIAYSFPWSGSPHINYPFASFSTAMGRNGLIPNPELQPLLSTEYETGVDIRFFNNRLGLDFTMYSQKTTNDILQSKISTASGFGSTYYNLGELTNKGIEVLLNATPVEGSFTWDVSLNFARNKNEVVSLVEGLEEVSLEEPRTRTVRVKHIVGYPFGMLTGWVQKTTPDGRLIYESNGSPVQSDRYEIIGYGVPDFVGGIENTIRWKGINLSFLIDFKSGGNIFSGTNVRLTQTGLTKLTLQGRDPENPLIVEGAIQTDIDSLGNPVYEDFVKTLTPREASNYWGNLGNRATDRFTYDASYVKLRQLTLGYYFPQSILSKTPFNNLSISFVGRNLWIIHKNTPNIDPETSYTNRNSQGLDYFAMPPVRSWGFNLKVGF